MQKCSISGQGVRERDLRRSGRSTEEWTTTPATRQDLAIRTINLLKRLRGVVPRTRPVATPSYSHTPRLGEKFRG